MSEIEKTRFEREIDNIYDNGLLKEIYLALDEFRNKTKNHPRYIIINQMWESRVFTLTEGSKIMGIKIIFGTLTFDSLTDKKVQII